MGARAAEYGQLASKLVPLNNPASLIVSIRRTRCENQARIIESFSSIASLMSPLVLADGLDKGCTWPVIFKSAY